MIKKYLKTTTMLIVLIGSIMSYSYTEKSDNFKIKFSKSNSSIIMNSNIGCSWNILSVKKKSFHLNQFGIVNVEKDIDAYSSSEFIISVKRSYSKITLKGMKGTNWKDLSFNLSSKKSSIIVTENGIISSH